jgi:hypothetical protein
VLLAAVAASVGGGDWAQAATTPQFAGWPRLPLQTGRGGHSSKGRTGRRTHPGLLKQLKTIDIFVNASTRTERDILFEFRTAAWPYLPTGGILVSDDVSQDRAVERFVSGVECDWVVGRQRRGGGFGIAVKRGATEAIS